MRMTMGLRGTSIVFVLATATVSAACDGGLGPGGSGQEVALSLRVVGGSPVPSPVAGPARVAGPPLVLEGTNGTLTLHEIRLIVDEVELHREGPECDSLEAQGGDCGEFESGPTFLDLPLDGQLIEAVTALIPPGRYDRLDFEIEDLEDDADDEAEAQRITTVRSEILAEIPDWPRKASAMVAGSFAPSAGGSIDFRVFLEAEIEIEMDLFPNLVVDDSGGSSRDLMVNVSPEIWFSRPDGTVLALHLHDFDLTGQLLELEVEMESGFTEIEFED